MTTHLVSPFASGFSRNFPRLASFVAAFALVFLFPLANVAQDKAAQKPSPAATATTTFDGVTVTVSYAQPAKKGREIFGQLVPFGEVWRTGANEATTITVSGGDVEFSGAKLKAGTYALFTIPNKDKWTIIVNSEAKQWGAYNYKQDKDVLRVEAAPSSVKEPVERFTIGFDKAASGATLTLTWDTTKIAVPMRKS